MATLTGQTIASTYDGLLKLSDNDGLTASVKNIEDGFGVASPVNISTAVLFIKPTSDTSSTPTSGKEFEVVGNALITGDLQIDNINIDGNTISASSGVVTLSNGTIATTQSQSDNSTKIATTAYVDTLGGTFLPLAGGTMSGSIAMGTNNISGGGTATFTSFVGALTGNASTSTKIASITNSNIVQLTSSQTLTNKTIDVDNNTVSNIEVDNFKASAIVIESEGIGSNDNDTTLPTSAAVKDYVDTQVTAQDLDFAGGSGTGAVDLDSQTFTIAGTTNEIETSASGQTLTVGLPSTVAITTKITSPIFGLGDGTSNKIQFIGGQGNWRVNISDSANQFVIHSESLASDYFTVIGGGGIKLNAYGSGNKTGTVAKNLAVDSSGNIIETDGGIVDGSGTANDVAMWSDANTLTDAPIAISGSNASFAGSVTSPNFIVSDGTDNYIQFDLNGKNSHFTNQSKSFIFSGQGASGDYLAGTLNFQSRSTADRDINFITGATPAKRLTLSSTAATFTGNVQTLATGSGTGVLLHTNSGITINSNLMQIWSGQSSGISFHTNSSGDGSNEKMLLDSSGNLIINDISSDLSSSGRGVVEINGTSQAILGLKVNGDVKTYLFQNGDNVELNNTASGSLTLKTAATTALTIDASQNSNFAGNVTISQSNSSSSDLINQNTHGTGLSRFIAQSNTTDQNAQLVADDNNGYAWVGSSTGGTNRVVFKNNTDAYYEGRNLGVGTTLPNAPLEATKAITFSNADTIGQFLIKSAVGATGDMLNFGVDSTNSLAFIQANEKGVDTIPLVLQRYGGNVGIGTDPDYTLHLLKSSGDTEMYINGQNGQSSLRMGLDARNWQIKTAAAPYLWSLNYVGTDFQTSNIITATTAGLVGIGTDSPDSKLHIDSGAAHGEIRLTTSTAAGYDAKFSLIAGTSGGISVLNLGYNGDDDYSRIFRTSSGDLRFDNNNGERMRITSDGNLTIGNTASLQPLTVAGNVLFRTTTANSFENRFQFIVGGASDAGNFYVYNDAESATIRLNGGGDSYINGGNLGISNTSPSSYNSNARNLVVGSGGQSGITIVGGTTGRGSIHFADGTSGSDASRGFVVYKHDDNSMLLGTNDTLALTIDSSQRVGVGTTSPTHKLQILSTDNKSFLLDRNTGNNAASLDEFSVYYSLSIKNRNGGSYLNFAGNGNGTTLQATDGAATATAKSLQLNPFGGNVAIGTGLTLPASTLSLQNSQSTAANNTTTGSIFQALSPNSGIFMRNRGASAGIGGANYSTQLFTDSGAGNFEIYNIASSADLVFGTNATERARITSDGDILFGTTSLGNDFAYFDAESNNRRVLNLGSSSTSEQTLVNFRNPNGVVGGVSTDGSTTSFGSSSDYRLKENVVEMTDALDRVSQLKPSRFNFIANPDKTYDGFLAHEVQDIVPEAISGDKDEVDEDGNEKYQGIDQSKLVPLLVGAIQELKAEIEILKNK